MEFRWRVKYSYFFEGWRRDLPQHSFSVGQCYNDLRSISGDVCDFFRLMAQFWAPQFRTSVWQHSGSLSSVSLWVWFRNARISGSCVSGVCNFRHWRCVKSLGKLTNTPKKKTRGNTLERYCHAVPFKPFIYIWMRLELRYSFWKFWLALWPQKVGKLPSCRSVRLSD